MIDLQHLNHINNKIYSILGPLLAAGRECLLRLSAEVSSVAVKTQVSFLLWLWLPAGMNHMSYDAWRMPATLTKQPDVQANMPTLASHCSSEFICPVARGRLYAVTSAFCFRPYAHSGIFPHGIFMFGVISLWSRLSFGSR